MNSTEIFSIALGLVSPWKISDVRFETTTTSAHELHIYLDFERGSKFSSRTGEQTTAYDTEEKQWQHLNFLTMTGFAICIKCEKGINCNFCLCCFNFFYTFT
jgi:hypothetical protein